MGRRVQTARLSAWLSAVGLWTASNVAAQAAPATSDPAPLAEEERSTGKADAEGQAPAKSQAKAKGTAKKLSAQPERERGQSYHWHVVAADAASVLGGVALAASIDSNARHRPSDAGLIAAAWYGFGAMGAPAVHYAHGNSGIGAASLGLRLFIPPLTSVIGLVSTCLGRGEFVDECREDGLTGGALVGLAGVAILDGAVLANPRPRVKRAEHWYGWKLLVLDGAALALGAYVAAKPPRTESGEKINPEVALWVPDYVAGLFGGPIIHALEGEWLSALGSLGLRSLVGPMGALPGVMGYCSTSGGVRGCAGSGALFGLVGGLLAVDLFDALVLAHSDADITETSRFMPIVSAGPGYIAISGALP